MSQENVGATLGNMGQVGVVTEGEARQEEVRSFRGMTLPLGTTVP